MNLDATFDEEVIEREGDQHDAETGEARPAEKLVEESDRDNELNGRGEE